MVCRYTAAMPGTGPADARITKEFVTFPQPLLGDKMKYPEEFTSSRAA